MPEGLALAAEADAEVDHRKANAVQGVKDDRTEQGNLAELEERLAECFEGRIERFRILQVVNRVHVDDEVANQRNAGYSLNPERHVADVFPSILALEEFD